MPCQKVRFLRTPASPLVYVKRRGFVHQRIEDSPGFENGIVSREKGRVTDDRVSYESLVSPHLVFRTVTNVKLHVLPDKIRTRFLCACTNAYRHTVGAKTKSNIIAAFRTGLGKHFSRRVPKLYERLGYAEVARRPRGVVEKCTFCIQRIDSGLRAGLTPGEDPEATPACVDICPVGARIFGDLKDESSKINQVLNETATFTLREDLGTKPNVFYIPPKEGL